MAPATHSSQHLAGRVIASRTALEGERKFVTVLFADVKGSMELLADRDPEEARKLLDPVIDRMMEAVHRYEGTVNQVMGDGIMALFGAPLACEDHALRACHAALRMQGAVARHAGDIFRSHGVELQIRVGVNSGDVVVRSIASDLRLDYSAVGQSTHLAARMEQLARPNTILLTAATRRLVEGHVETRPVGAVPVKGLAQPVEVFELLQAGRPKSRFEIATTRGLTPFTGRDAETLQLSAALEQAASGHGQVVAAVGAPGVGKSRLVWEFLRSPRLDGWRVLEARGTAHDHENAYAPIIDLARAYFGIAESDDAQSLGDKVTRGIGNDDEHRLRTPLLALLNAAPDDPRWAALSSDQRRRRTLASLREIFVLGSQAQPLCLVVEDLHAIDAETQTVLDALVDALATARILLIVTYRPEYRHTWANKSSYVQLRIDPLSPGAAAAVARSLLGNAPRVTALWDLLIERTEGNPFFLEESVRALAESGVLAGPPGAYTITRPVDAIPVPETVHAALAARIDRLSEEDKRLLQAASSLGRRVPLPLLQQAVDVSEDALSESLARLQAREFLHEVHRFPEVEYVFTHALTQEAAYGGLLRERRHALDAAIVGAIEKLAPDRRADHLDRLAYHAFRGELWDKAVTYCREAARLALARSAHRAGVAFLERALAALARLPGDGLAAAIDLRLELRAALAPLGSYRRMHEVLTEAEQLAAAHADRRRLALVSAHLSNFFVLRGELVPAVDRGVRALELSSGEEDATVRILANANLSIASFAQGRFRQAIDFAAANVMALTGPRRFEKFGLAVLPAVYCLTVTAIARAELGDFAGAEAVAQEGIDIAREAEHPHSVISGYMGLGSALLTRGRPGAAREVLEHARALCESGDLPAVLVEITMALAGAHAHLGAIDEALRALEAGVAQAIALRHRLGHWIRTGGFAETYLCAGRIDEALSSAQLFVHMTQAIGARGAAAWAHRLVGLALARQDPADFTAAELSLRRSFELAVELGMQPLEAHCSLELTAVDRARGHDVASRVDAALRLYRELGMDPAATNRLRGPLVSH